MNQANMASNVRTQGTGGNGNYLSVEHNGRVVYNKAGKKCKDKNRYIAYLLFVWSRTIIVYLLLIQKRVLLSMLLTLSALFHVFIHLDPAFRSSLCLSKPSGLGFILVHMFYHSWQTETICDGMRTQPSCCPVVCVHRAEPKNQRL